MPHQGSRRERSEAQPTVVEDTGRLRVAGVEDLETAVEKHPVDEVGADPATDRIRCLENVNAAARSAQMPRAGQAGEAGTHHQYVRCRHGVTVRRTAGLDLLDLLDLLEPLDLPGVATSGYGRRTRSVGV
ncbi:MAG: hypothetical protein NVS3B26_27160 [Mycobacteriales bacterium]